VDAGRDDVASDADIGEGDQVRLYDASRSSWTTSLAKGSADPLG
jgi:hypothetical protein